MNTNITDAKNEYVADTLAARPDFRGQPKYEMISKIAYLIGVPKRIFDNEHEPPKPEVYAELEKDAPSRIVRDLCVLRSEFERNFKKIADAVKAGTPLMMLSDCLTTSAFSRLESDGIRLYKPNRYPSDYILEINRLLSDRINNVKNQFPSWIKFDYVRSLFIMPNGLKPEGIKAAADTYYSNILKYPYKVYINWNPDSCGNILFNDQKFVELLYEWNGDCFYDTSKVSDVSEFTHRELDSFIDSAGRLVIAVDCENSDPYSLAAVLASLPDEQRTKIASIILFDDVNTTKTWQILSKHTDIPIEHLLVERLKENKSLVDMRLMIRIVQEIERNHLDSCILCSSDSDYWALIDQCRETKFLVMAEHDKCGPDIKDALIKSGIFYCYIDDFYSAGTVDLKTEVLLAELGDRIDDLARFNINDMIRSACEDMHVYMSPEAKQKFYDKYIRSMKLELDAEGNVSIRLKPM